MAKKPIRVVALMQAHGLFSPLFKLATAALVKMRQFSTQD
jgi:hypothetical protein